MGFLEDLLWRGEEHRKEPAVLYSTDNMRAQSLVFKAYL